MKPIIMSTEDVRGILDGRKTMARMPIKPQPECFYDISQEEPFRPGDVLWVRETWARLSEKEYLYQADDTDVNVWKIRQKNGISTESDRWMSPVTMPREAARLFLRVKDVRVERVQDIGADDAYAEGYHETEPIEHRPRSWFSSIWNARNAKRGYGWDSNPYVWVIEFERTPSGAIGPEPDRTAPNGDKGAEQ